MPFFEVVTGIPSRVVVEADDQKEADAFVRKLFKKFEPIFSPERGIGRLDCSPCGATLLDTRNGRSNRYLLIFDQIGNFQYLCLQCVTAGGILREIHDRGHGSL